MSAVLATRKAVGHERQCVASMSWSLPSICALASLERIPQRLGLQADRVSSARSCTASVA